MRTDGPMPATLESGSYRFTETRWSLVAGLGMGEVDRRRCLAELCRTYYFPVYAHIRNQGCSEQEAYEYTTGFFESLIESLEQGRPEGRFRTFLLRRLEAFLNDPTGCSETRSPIPNPPTREAMAARFSNAQAKEAVAPGFDAIYAREVIARSLQHLREEAERNGRTEMFDVLVSYLTREPSPSEMQALTSALGLSRIGMTVALKRLRARFNELVTRELSETVDNPADLDSERETLHQVLRHRPS